MKLAEWARKNGVCYKTAYRWFRAGQLPVPVKQLATGTILVEEATVPATGTVAIYARVSSHDQKKDLDRQVARLVRWATEKNLSVTKVVSEIGSGLNGKRPQLLKLLRDPQVTSILVEHRERLARFGWEMIEACLISSGRSLLVVEYNELRDDLVQDMTDVLTSFCARLYGKRSAKNRAKKAMDACK